ncbi:MAG: hypothetical protein ACOYIS_06445 [Candidatus Cloacimonadaceae bacterium]|jgi:hypothetical protein
MVLLLALAVLSLNLVCAGWDYSAIPPQSLPVFTGSLNDPDVQIIFEDADGEFVFVLHNGVFYIFYL